MRTGFREWVFATVILASTGCSSSTDPAAERASSEPEPLVEQADCPLRRGTITTGSHHSCGVDVSGALYCWGSDAFGQIGVGPGSVGTSVLAPTRVALDDVIDVSAGVAHTCAVTADGALYCWGSNARGAVGDGTSVLRPSPTRVNIPKARRVSAGLEASCALLVGGRIACWGANDEGQLGNGTLVDSHFPTAVVGIDHGVDVSIRYSTACAVRHDGAAYCWGHNFFGTVGDGTTADRSTPVRVSGLAPVRQIASGYFSTCALARSGRVHCWGSNAAGELGDGTLVSRSFPGPAVVGIHHALRVDVSYAELADGSLRGWGDNDDGSLGTGGSPPFSASPLEPRFADGSRLPRASSFSATRPYVRGHVCALAGGAAYCWGDNDDGQLGNGTFSNVPEYNPVPVIGFP